MRVPVFISCPTTLSPKQQKQRDIIVNILEDLMLEPRALGRSDYPKDFPLKEVYIIAKHCAGGIIMGFEQIKVTNGIIKPGTGKNSEKKIKEHISMPTPWNHLEAGILFGLKLPLLIFREVNIEGKDKRVVSGGVFDYGISDCFVHDMPSGDATEDKKSEIKQVILRWYAEVDNFYRHY